MRLPGQTCFQLVPWLWKNHYSLWASFMHPQNGQVWGGGDPFHTGSPSLKNLPPEAWVFPMKVPGECQVGSLKACHCKSQLCGLHCECFPKPPAKYSSPTLISPYWNFLYHFLYYGMYSQLRFFLVFIIPRNLLQQDLHNRLSWNVNEWMNVSLSTLWIQMTFKNYFRTFWWDLEAERPGIIIIEGT